nr:hypothetical protein [uncultured Rhodopila sp.]
MARRVVRKPEVDVKEAPEDVPRGGLGTEIAALFKDVGLRDGEEIPELRGHCIKPWIFDDC